MERWLESQSPSVRALLICGAFIALSTWCTLYNKFIFEHVFHSSNALLLVQNLVAVATLLLLRSPPAGFIHKRWSAGRGSPSAEVKKPASGLIELDLTLSRADIICGFAYSLNVAAGLWSLVFVNIAMFGCLKRCTVVASWVIELLFARTDATMKAALPIAVMTVGTVVASYNDLMFHPVGYALAIVSCIAQGSAFELGRRVAQKKKGVAQVLYANSVVAIGLQVFLLVATGDYAHLAPSRLSVEVLFHFALNAASCLAMNYVIFLNCLVNSPLAHAVTGNIKAAFTTLFGVMVFAAPLTALGWVGVVGNFGGAAWFTALKMPASSAASTHVVPPAAARKPDGDTHAV